jgi:hypothetical protein
MFNDNPYTSPVDVEKGIYSHKLFWRFVKAISAICFIIFIADIFIYLQWFEIEPAKDEQKIEKFISFLSNI